MSAVGEAKLIISADDRTGSAFKSLERKVQDLGKATKSVGDAAGSVGKIAAEVDRVSGSVAKATDSVEHYGDVLRTIDKASRTMPKLSGDADAMAKAMQGVAAAERNVATETDRIARAGSKLSLFKALSADFKGARATFDLAKADLSTIAKKVEDNDRRATALRQRRDIALAAEARARAAYEAAPIPRRADAADAERFNAMRDARATAASTLQASTKERQKIEAELHAATDGVDTRKLARSYADAQKATSLASSALEMQRSALKGVKADFERLAGPLTSVSGAEKRLVADAEAATRAFEDQARAAGVMAEATSAALAREEAAFARAAEGRARWQREFAALDARAGGQRAALAPERRASAVELLHEAMRHPAHETSHSTAGRELAALAATQMRLNAFKEVQAASMGLGGARIAANAEAARVAREVAAATTPSAELLAAHAEAQEHAAAATHAFTEQAGTLKSLKAEIEAVIGPMHSLASAETEIAERAGRAGVAMKRQEAMHRRLHALKDMAEDVLPFEGPEILHLTGEALHEGAKVQAERVGLINAGRTPEELAEIEARSREVSGKLPTATTEENLKVVGETTGAFGSVEHAMQHLEFMQRTMSVLHTAAGDKIQGGAAEVGRQLAKFFEDRQTAPEDFEKEASALIPGMVATGGVFNPNELYNFALQAKSSLPAYDMEFLSKYMPSIVAASNGQRAGTAANAFTSIIMGKANDKKQAEAWEKLGLLDTKKAIMKSGNVVSWQAGAIKNTSLALANPVRWSEEVLLPAMQAHGIDISNREAVMTQLATMFRNQNGNVFANEIAQAASLKRLHKDAGLYGAVGSAVDIYNRNLHENPEVALHALGEAVKTFAGNLTSPLMKDAANVLGNMSQEVAHWGEALADFDADHPDLAKLTSGAAAATALGVGGYLTTKLFTNLGSLFRGGANAAAAAEMTRAGGLQVQAGRMMLEAAGKGMLGGGPGGTFGRAAPGGLVAAGGAVEGLAIPAVAEAAAAAVVLIGAAAVVGLVKAANAAQEPGQGGMWAKPTPKTEGLDRDRLKFLDDRALELQHKIERNKAEEKLPGTSGPLNFPLERELSDVDNERHTLRDRLAHMYDSPDREAEHGRAMMGIDPWRHYGPDGKDLPDGWRPPSHKWEMNGPNLPPPPPLHTDPGYPGVESRTFGSYLHKMAPLAAAGEMPQATRPRDPVTDLHDIKATVTGPVTATVTGQANVKVTVVVQPSSALLQAVAKAEAAAMKLSSGAAGPSTNAGQSRVVPAPAYGIGHR